jgi:hypothetical protein
MITLGSSRQGGQLTQATEKPPGETAGWAPADVATEVLERQDVKSVLGRQVRSITGEDMGRVVNVVVDRGAAMCGAANAPPPAPK